MDGSAASSIELYADGVHLAALDWKRWMGEVSYSHCQALLLVSVDMFLELRHGSEADPVLQSPLWLFP